MALLDRDQVRALAALADAVDELEQADRRRRSLEASVWRSGVSAAQIAAVTGEHKWTVYRRHAPAKSTPQLSEVLRVNVH